MNGNNFNGPGTSLSERLGINERPLDLLSYNNGLFRALDKQAVIENPEKSKPSPGPDDKNWFYVENPGNESISVTITNSKSSGAPFDSIEISDDKENWTELILDNDTYTFDIPATSKVYLRAEQSSWDGWNINTTQFNVGGNIMSLLYGENFEGETTLESDYTFAGLFSDSGVVDASELLLSATTLTDSCYEGMFESCTSLTTAPQLPDTTLVDYCYAYMFQDCTLLTEAPELPATTIADGCYECMFYGCTSLTSVPELPATTLYQRCYYGMFNGCTSLTAAPELPATTLAESCYYDMFLGCTSLNTVITHANDISANSCLIDWLKGVANSGTFYNLGTAEYTTGPSGIPTDWTIETELPQE